MYKILSLVLFFILSLIYFATFSFSNQKQSLILQSTTTTYDSGFLNYLLPIYEKKTGIKIYPLISGSGRALINAKNGDCDIVLLHSKQDEIEFIKKGYGTKRYDLMYNYFVLIGPINDPAQINNSTSIITAFEKISQKESTFISRGDESGTHKKEQSIWNMTSQEKLKNKNWYYEAGSGMGATIQIAINKNGYILSDRASWETFKNKSNHKILYDEGNKNTFNQYGLLLPKHSNKEKSLLAQKFIDWLLSKEGQKVIEAYQYKGKQLFFPNAKQI